MTENPAILFRAYKTALVRQSLKKRGWSQRKAAKYLRKNFTHLNLVLNGRRQSARLLSEVAAIPPYQSGMEGGR
ncbi:MAG TPA: hypothetical protein PKE26_11065 [Kiritimatiellia bacterium]|nr:hypothetical protein [Kiritimatiellia bacterium]HMO99639.1 hypothetical protein [Kiritimatiellia bacterium]HMP97114.1 hypothetical protein [Kiritimatiellia bacterium]